MAVLRSQVEPRNSLDMEMDFSMAFTAKRNEIFFHNVCLQILNLRCILSNEDNEGNIGDSRHPGISVEDRGPRDTGAVRRNGMSSFSTR